MANLNGWRAKALAHLKEFQPRLYRELKQKGKLENHLDELVDRTAREVEELSASGMTEAEAWEAARSNLMPTPEPEGAEDAPTSQSELNKLHAQIADQSD